MTVASPLRHFSPSRWLGRGRSGWQSGEPVLQAIPPSLRALDALFEAEWRGGAFALAGYSIPIGAASPFAIAEAPQAWLEALNGFGWLRHVAPHSDADAQAVEAVVADWLRRGESPIASENGVTARRVLSWLAHADLLLQTSDVAFYDAVLGALRNDIIRLQRRAPTIESARERLLAWIALAQAGLCIERAVALHRTAEAAIGSEFEKQGASLRQVLRDPDDLADLLLDLEALRLLYGMRGLAVPQQISYAKEVISEVLGGLTLEDNSVARLGSGRIQADRGATMASVARHVNLAPATPCHNTMAGFARLAQGETRMVADVGAPFRSRDALVLEVSSGSAPMLVHDGLGQRKGETSRGTLVLTATGAADGGNDPRRHAPTLEPTHSVEVDVDSSSLQSFDATHAGAALAGHAHRRRVVLSQDGQHIDGVDELRPLVGRVETPDARFAVRFVLHPSVQTTLGASPDQLDLTLANGHRWRLAAPGCVISVEGAVYRDGMRTVPTLQALVPADPAGGRTVAWHLVRRDVRAADQEIDDVDS